MLGWQGSDGTVCRGAELEDALDAVVLDESVTEDLREFTGGVAAKDIHLEEAVLRGDKTLGEDEVVEGSGADVRDAARVALDRDRSREARQGEGSINLRERRDEGVVDIAAKSEEGSDAEDYEDRSGDGDEL